MTTTNTVRYILPSPHEVIQDPWKLAVVVPPEPCLMLAVNVVAKDQCFHIHIEPDQFNDETMLMLFAYFTLDIVVSLHDRKHPTVHFLTSSIFNRTHYLQADFTVPLVQVFQELQQCVHLDAEYPLQHFRQLLAQALFMADDSATKEFETLKHALRKYVPKPFFQSQVRGTVHHCKELQLDHIQGFHLRVPLQPGKHLLKTNVCCTY